MKALSRANQVRFARASTKRWIATAPTRVESRERAVEVLLDPPEHMLTLEAHALICTIARVGSGLATRICGELRIGLLRTVGDLTERQRKALAEHLRAHVPVTRQAPSLLDVIA